MFKKEVEKYFCFIDDINNEIKINILKFRNISLVYKPKQAQFNNLNFINVKEFKNFWNIYGMSNTEAFAFACTKLGACNGECYAHRETFWGCGGLFVWVSVYLICRIISLDWENSGRVICR